MMKAYSTCIPKIYFNYLS